MYVLWPLHLFPQSVPIYVWRLKYNIFLQNDTILPP